VAAVGSGGLGGSREGLSGKAGGGDGRGGRLEAPDRPDPWRRRGGAMGLGEAPVSTEEVTAVAATWFLGGCGGALKGWGAQNGAGEVHGQRQPDFL
jgi:hypothetical protein